MLITELDLGTKQPICGVIGIVIDVIIDDESREECLLTILGEEARK